MNTIGLKRMAIGALACVLLAAPLTGSAQGYHRGNYGGQYQQERYNHGDYRFDRGDLKAEVDSVGRESKNFRSYFERNFRDNGHAKRYAGGDHGEHEGRRGQMTLQDAIQNLDEDIERIRAEVRHHGRSAYARELMPEILSHMRDVDTRIDRVADAYTYGRERNWRYTDSELYQRWQDLRSDINQMAREVR